MSARPTLRRLAKPALALAALMPAALMSGAFASAAHAEVTESSDTHFVLRHAADVAAAPDEVWRTLIAPAGWWGDDRTWSGDAANLTLTPQAGSCFCESIPAQDGEGSYGLEGSVQHMTVVQAVPGRVLRMSGALGPLQSEPVDGVMTLTLQPIEDADRGANAAAGTRIVWEYVVGGAMRFEVPEIAAAVDGVLGEQMSGLARALGGAIAPGANRPSAFDDAFGPDAGAPGEDDEEGGTPVTDIGEGR